AWHLVWRGTYGLDLGATTPVLWCFRDREEILDMLEELCGSRMNFNYYRPGGVLYDLPPGWVSKLSRFLDRYEKNIENDYVTILDENEIFLDRTVGVGTIPSDLAKAYGLTGPMLRGSGVDWDLRRDRPYSIYPELTSLKPVVYTDGDAYARYRVRLGVSEGRGLLHGRGRQRRGWHLHDQRWTQPEPVPGKDARPRIRELADPAVAAQRPPRRRCRRHPPIYRHRPWRCRPMISVGRRCPLDRNPLFAPGSPRPRTPRPAPQRAGALGRVASGYHAEGTL